MTLHDPNQSEHEPGINISQLKTDNNGGMTYSYLKWEGKKKLNQIKDKNKTVKLTSNIRLTSYKGCKITLIFSFHFWRASLVINSRHQLGSILLPSTTLICFTNFKRDSLYLNFLFLSFFSSSNSTHFYQLDRFQSWIHMVFSQLDAFLNAFDFHYVSF